MSENSIELVIAQNPVLAITNPEKFAEFLKGIKAEIEAHKPDVSTPKGRKEIKSLAYKVTRTKTAIDDAGKELNAAKRKEIDAVDKERRDIRAKLDELADEIRKPLTEWEEAEEDRLADVSRILTAIATAAYIPHGATSEDIQDKAQSLDLIILDPEILQDDLTAAVLKKEAAQTILKNALDAALKYEADQAELARLRAEAEERERQEAERREREAVEKAERERVEREQKEAQERQEREERERQEIAARAAEEARQAEIRKAKAEQEERDRAARAEIEAANSRAAELEKRAQERREAEYAERVAQQAREADRKHRSKIMSEAKSAIMEIGASEEVAKNIVRAIVAGEIPNVTLRF